MKNHIASLCLSLFVNTFLFAQEPDKAFKYRSIVVKDSIVNGWQSIALKESVLGLVKSDLSDLRVYSVSDLGDTLEVPYFIKTHRSSEQFEEVLSEKINDVTFNKDRYMTFKTSELVPINLIDLQINEINFDQKVDLEGSNDQNKWFTILKDHRVSGISNATISYRYSKLNFKTVQYAYYRLKIPNKKVNLIQSVKLLKRHKIDAKYQNYQLKKFEVDSSQKGETLIEFEFNNFLPLERVLLVLKEDLPFYRSYQTEVLKDSIKDKGKWVYFYSKVSKGVIESKLDSINFKVSGYGKRFRVTIFNEDNSPLKVEKVIPQGFRKDLILKLNQPVADLQMVWGSSKLGPPKYDLEHFKSHVPNQITSLEIVSIDRIDQTNDQSEKPLVGFDVIIWLVIGAISFLMIYFSFKMLRNY